MTKITAVMNAHREGLLAGMSIASFVEARTHAEGRGLEVEPLFILDRPDTLTRQMFADNPVQGARIEVTDFGDPGLSRNYAAEIGTGNYITYLDSDDLWSFNWITEATAFMAMQNKPTILHSEMNWVFGEVRNFWIHADSEAPDFDPSYLAVGNYWDAMSFLKREMLLEQPFHQNQLKDGYGHEDWHWNCATYLAGIAHRPVPGTVHMKRRRAGSQMARCADSDVVPFITDIYRMSRKAHLATAKVNQTPNKPVTDSHG